MNFYFRFKGDCYVVVKSGIGQDYLCCCLCYWSRSYSSSVNLDLHKTSRAHEVYSPLVLSEMALQYSTVHCHACTSFIFRAVKTKLWHKDSMHFTRLLRESVIRTYVYVPVRVRGKKTRGATSTTT
jgi:hypothetical protein